MEYVYQGTPQTILVSAYTKEQHVSKQPSVRLHVEAGRNAIVVTLNPAKVRELVEDLITALWTAEDG